MKRKIIKFSFLFLLAAFTFAVYILNSLEQEILSKPLIDQKKYLISLAEMYNEKASDPKNKPDQVIKSLKIKPGEKIADIGAGGGYFTFRFSKETGNKGRVYAVDIMPTFLEYIIEKSYEKGLSNITYILAKVDDPNLPEKSVGLVFVRNVFHLIAEPVYYFKKVKTSLKPGGRVAIIEHTKKSKYGEQTGHYTEENDIVKKMDLAGYRVLEKFDFLPGLSFLTFGIKK